MYIHVSIGGRVSGYLVRWPASSQGLERVLVVVRRDN